MACKRTSSDPSITHGDDDNAHQNDINHVSAYYMLTAATDNDDDKNQEKKEEDKNSIDTNVQGQDDYDDSIDGLETHCGCGAILAKDWICSECRISCPDCNRSLTNDPQDFCSRCNSQCQEHGLFKNQEYRSCPQCI